MWLDREVSLAFGSESFFFDGFLLKRNGRTIEMMLAGSTDSGRRL